MMIPSRKSIESGNHKYLLKPAEDYLAGYFIEKLREVLSDYIFIRFSSVEELSSSVGQTNLFGEDKRVLILSELEKESLNKIEYLTDQEISEILILVESSILPKNKSYTKIKAACTFIEINNLNEGECSVEVRKWLTDSGVKFQDDIPSYIVEKKGTHIGQLKGEVRKILLLAGDKYIDRELCDRVLIEDKEVQFFSLSDLFFRKRVTEVFKEVSKIDEYSYVKFIHFLIGQIERLYKVAIYREQGMDATQIGSVMKLPSFIVKTKVVPLLAFNNKVKLLMMMDLLNKLDVELRSSKFPKSLVVESYLLKAMKL